MFPKHAIPGLNCIILLTHTELVSKISLCFFFFSYKAKSFLSYIFATRLWSERTSYNICWLDLTPGINQSRADLYLSFQGNDHSEWQSYKINELIPVGTVVDSVSLWESWSPALLKFFTVYYFCESYWAQIIRVSSSRWQRTLDTRTEASSDLPSASKSQVTWNLQNPLQWAPGVLFRTLLRGEGERGVVTAA